MLLRVASEGVVGLCGLSVLLRVSPGRGEVGLVLVPPAFARASVLRSRL
jgi:hypothetical protein